MTANETLEWRYVNAERLGMLCEDKEPTVEQKRMAAKDADEAIERMRNEKSRMV